MAARGKFENQKTTMKTPGIKTGYIRIDLIPQNQLKNIINYTLELTLF